MELRLRFPEPVRDALGRLALAERRELRGQAEILVLEGLERRGLLERDRSEHAERPLTGAAR